MLEFFYTSISDSIPAIPIVPILLVNPKDSAITFVSEFGIIDTGSDITAVSFSVISKLRLRPLPSTDLPPIKIMGHEVKGVPYLVDFGFDRASKNRVIIFAIPDDVIKDEVIVGRNILNLYQINLDGCNGTFTIS